MKKADEHVLKQMRMFCSEIAASVAHIHYEDFILPQKYEKRNSCLFALLQIGELAKKLSDEVKSHHGDVIWKNWSGVRNTIAHNYEGFDMRRAWKLCTKHSPELANAVGEILEEEG